MISTRSVLTAAMVLCLSNASLAEEYKLSKKYSDCMDRTGGATVPMRECIAEETKRQDAQLNRVYKQLMASLSPARKKQLQNAQRAWIKFRDLNCGFYADPEGGTMALVAADDCYLTMTAERVNELESFKEP